MTDDDDDIFEEDADPAPDDAADEGAIPPEWPDEDDPSEQAVL